MGLGHRHAGRCRFRNGRTALLAEVTREIQRPFAETADDCSRLCNGALKRFLQRLFVDFHMLIVKAGTTEVPGTRTRRHDGSCCDLQWDRGRRPLRWLLRGFGPRRRARFGCRRSHGGATLKAESHPVGNARSAFWASQHTFAANPIALSDKTLTASYYTPRDFSSASDRPEQWIGHMRHST